MTEIQLEVRVMTNKKRDFKFLKLPLFVCFSLSLFCSCRKGVEEDPRRLALLSSRIFTEAIKQRQQNRFPEENVFREMCAEFWKNHGFSDSECLLIFPQQMTDDEFVISNRAPLGVLVCGEDSFLLNYNREKNLLTFDPANTSVSSFRAQRKDDKMLGIIFSNDDVLLEWSNVGEVGSGDTLLNRPSGSRR